MLQNNHLGKDCFPNQGSNHQDAIWKKVKMKVSWLQNNEYVLTVFLLWVDLPTCVDSKKIGNGICDGDINVGGNCEFDGGDCCKFLIDDSGCSGDSCVCNEDNLLHFSLEE